MPDAEPERSKLLDAATVGAYRFGSLASRLMPSAVAQAAASSLGFTASFASQARREMIARHLRRVNPKLQGTALRLAVQQAFDSYARYYMESFRLPSLSARTVDRAFSTEGFEQIPAALEAGKGCIFALPHLGGWEWAGRWMTDQGYKLTVVVEALQPPELFEWFAELRQNLGMTVVPTGPKAGPAVLAALRANEIVCLLCDRDIDRHGVEVEFFGERTTLPAGPATMALRTGAPVLPVGVYFTQRTNGHHAVVRPPLPLTRLGGLRDDVSRITQLLAHELEFLIRRAPEQWHLFQPNWPSDPGY
ncbi:MAG: phosphatidylinositol mannoside acyltransferase [Ilumatobacter sp.]|nr:phosphatidylinositol mannoside acyltransferase [Ilumatobacter sp.]MCB0983461.1 phosphatidylinositol mannoside acyltransferase [Ilumatobacter sp.]